MPVTICPEIISENIDTEVNNNVDTATISAQYQMQTSPSHPRAAAAIVIITDTRKTGSKLTVRLDKMPVKNKLLLLTGNECIM